VFLKNLIIVESPAKAKTISNFLPKGRYKVLATKGHIRDLPDKRFGIEISEDGEIVPKYSISRENQKKLKDIKEYAKKAETIYLATDEDREGEAIGYHTAVALKKEPTEIPRIVFHEVTKSAIQNALKNPRNIDMNLVNAQQTRRVLDRIVGYKLSPLLASKIQRGLSAGRVQSSSLKIVVDREREIKKFIPVEYWQIPTIFKKDLEANLIEFDKEKLGKLSISNIDKATEIWNSIQKEKFKIESIENKQRSVSPPPPFMTSTLQQTASNKLGFSPKKTMSLAQKLYEGVELPDGKKSGLITYMRTDSLNLSKESREKAVEKIQNEYGEDFGKEIRNYSTKSKGAQEAHEAIRPTISKFLFNQLFFINNK
jgi:DNA topoisomerase-1